MPYGDWVLILDLGSQYSQLIARRVRELGVYSEIRPPETLIPSDDPPAAIILSGGPDSVFSPDSPRVDPSILNSGLPILGICYGLHLIVLEAGGEVKQAGHREYGRAEINLDQSAPIFSGLPSTTTVWMSHGDMATKLPPGFVRIADTDNCPIAAIADRERRIYAFQFHPEVLHTPQGPQMLDRFLFEVAGLKPGWDMGSFADMMVPLIREQVGDSETLLALSGGVDSSVTAALTHLALGSKLHCVFVDNGLLREGEYQQVIRTFRTHFQLNLHPVRASTRFLKALQAISSPERKRKIIGREFIRIFEEWARGHPKIKFLAQGTLYPDVIESTQVAGPSATIKTHHNVGGLPSRMNLKLVEPLRFLFKDEVRKLGTHLGLPEEIIGRHPFPGPGLAVRILGPITSGKLKLLRAADTIFIEELRSQGLYDSIWQAFCVLLPVKSVGVMGDQRTYQNVLSLRAVHSTDGMTADWFRIPEEVLARVSNRIINEVHGINRVVYDISSKPPSTIEWE
ncbi:glutamine-hydrolyzing GMP synthase [candidate division KSB1 bacterium]